VELGVVFEVLPVRVDGELHAASIQPDVGLFVLVGVHAVADDVRDGIEVAECCHDLWQGEIK
jgi:hypothetical protein